MKIALVFDDLIQFGGAERLLLAVHELYPDAPVYTSLASDEWIARCKEKNIRLVTSWMQGLPFKRSLNRFYGLLGLHALAFESFKFDDFDVAISISARFAHGIATKPCTLHICYMNSPGRMFWESQDYFDRENFLRYDLVRRLFWFFATPFLSLLRLCDYAGARRVDYFIANSKTPQARIAKYYKRDSSIIYPFVDDIDQLKGRAPVTSDSAVRLGGRGPSEDGGVAPYYLVVTRLNAWKRVDIAIEACKTIGANLKIIGEGPDRLRLEKLATGNNKIASATPRDDIGDNGQSDGSDDNPRGNQTDSRDDTSIDFLGYVSDEEKTHAMQNCTALIVTQKEDFGITALEAMALGKPVIAYRAGGVLETVIEGVTGEFFDAQTPQSLAQKLSSFTPSTYKAQDCINQSSNFSKQKLLTKLDEAVKTLYNRKTNLP